MTDTDRNQIVGLVDGVILQLLDVPEDKQAEALERILHEYQRLLTAQWPERAEEAERFVVLFAEFLRRRWNALAATADGTVGTA